MSTIGKISTTTANAPNAMSLRPGQPKAVTGESVVEKETPGIKIFGVIGALWVAFVGTIWFLWITSPHFGPTPLGADLPSAGLVIWTRTVEVLSSSLAIYVIYRFLIRPWVRDRRISWDGLLVFTSITLFFQDPLMNYSSYWFYYSAIFFNWGSWTYLIPGSMVPNGNLIPETPFAWGASYIWEVVLCSVLCGNFVRRLKNKNPSMGKLAVFGYTYLFMVVVDIILEGCFVGTGLYAFASVIPQFTLFAGETYQFPIYETFFWSFVWTAPAFLRFYRDDSGQSFVESGVDQLHLSDRKKTFIRWLAITGFCHSVMFACYTVPMNLIGMHGTVTPEYKSWMRAGVCGKDTAYDCASPTAPIPRIGSPTNRLAPASK